jgi:hypothetical protein
VSSFGFHCCLEIASGREVLGIKASQQWEEMLVSSPTLHELLNDGEMIDCDSDKAASSGCSHTT